MKKDEATGRLARQVSDLLREMLANSPERPRDADPFDWSSDVLDELARAVTTIGRVVDRLAGGPGSESETDPAAESGAEDTIEEMAREFVTAIVRQRNALLTESATRRHPGPVLPPAGTGAAPRP